ncbi:MAG: cytochrome d ubiquinol oxidase subunit II [Gemmatimonadales bacterium]
MLEQVVAGGMVASLVVYAVLGGADFGGGIWDLLARGPRAPAQREAIGSAIGPIWEANHVWLILTIVLLFTGFPAGFAATMTALNIPVTVMLIGIVLRGSAFVFGKYDPGDAAVRRRWGAVFGVSSVVTPFCQGAIVAALSSGDIQVVGGQVTTGFLAGWTTPFAASCGVFAVVLFAYLAATFLTIDTEGQPDLQDDFRRRALMTGAALIPVAGIVFVTTGAGAPAIRDGLTRWWGLLVVAGAAGCSVMALAGLWQRRFRLARIAAVGQVGLILAGGSAAQYPNIVAPDVTIQNAHAPEVTLRLLLVVVAIGALVLVPSLVFLFRLFKGPSSLAR